MLIQKCEKKDIEACANLLSAIYAEAPYNEEWELSDAIAYLERFREIDPNGCFVAQNNGEIIGAVFSFSYPWQRGKLVCIQELFVSSEKRMKGVARQLLAQMSHGEKIGAWLVAHENSEAVKFYQKMGFSQEGPYKFRHGTIFT
jgi:ribosomal protein S18 acetylase RimI-like enzyme